MSTTASYAATPQNALVQVSASNANRDGTGTIVDVLTAAANGTRCDDITITAVGTTTSGVVRLFLFDGASTRLWKEIMIPANTPSTSISVFTIDIKGLALILKSGWKLRASTNNAETFNIAVTRCGDF